MSNNKDIENSITAISDTHFPVIRRMIFLRTPPDLWIAIQVRSSVYLLLTSAGFSHQPKASEPSKYRLRKDLVATTM